MHKVLPIFLTLCAFLATGAPADQELEHQLASQYRDKVLALRHFYKARSQEYAVDGAPLNAGAEGPWTLYGRMRVQKISVGPDRLVLEGRRVLYFFDEKRKLTEYPDDRGHPFENLKITVRLQKPLSTADEVDTILGRIFALTADEVVNSAPAYWQAYLAKQLGVQSQKEQISRDADLCKLSPFDSKDQNVTTPPHALYHPDPDFSEAARVRRFQGVVGMNVIVDTTGKATNIEVRQPRGMGLDEQAIANVGAWKFAPAKKSGQACPIAMYIAIDFHLY